MLYVDNGRIGKLSVIGLGCWNFGAQWSNKVSKSEAISIIRYAIDHGVNFVDVAESYGLPDGQCEILLGEALKDGYRGKVKIISKIGWWGRRADDFLYAKESVVDKYAKKIMHKLYHSKAIDLQHRTPELLRLCGHACCGRLQTDFIDLMLCHDGTGADMEAFIEAFRILKNEGFILHYGISTDNIEVLKNFYLLSKGECVACEFDYSLLHRTAEKEIIPFCRENDISMFVRGALASGILSGKYTLETQFTEPARLSWNVGGMRRQAYEQKIASIRYIESITGDVGAKVAYPFVFSHPLHPCVVLGATSMVQMEENIQISNSFMSKDIYEKLISLG